MNQQPQLLAVPHFQRPLTVKATTNGITILKDGRFKKRYVGSKAYEVDINGKLKTTKDLRREIQESKKTMPKKMLSRNHAKRAKTNEKPTGTKVNKTYTLNKPEIRGRLLTLIACLPDHRKELYFWTVTFPLRTNDETIYRLFNIWLTKLRQKKLLRDYLWVTERQKNGTLHFHIAIPHKMSVRVANREMMICICNAVKAGEISYNLHAAKRYNGVDISKPRNKQGKTIGPVTNFATRRGKRVLINYISKYVTKNDDRFSQLAWHNSRTFSMLFTGITFTYEESRFKWQWRFFCNSRAAIDTEFFSFYPWITDPPSPIINELKKLNGHILNLN